MPFTRLNNFLPSRLENLKEFLDAKVVQYNRPEFILQHPISIPHRFTLRQDIELIGFWVAMLAWGQRKTIIQKAEQLIALMDYAPYDFVRNHQEKGRLQAIGAFPDGTLNAYRIVDPRQFILTASFDL